jgi:hypothetical protein
MFPDMLVCTYNTRYQNPETPLINHHRVNLKILIVLATLSGARFKQTPITSDTSYSKTGVHCRNNSPVLDAMFVHMNSPLDSSS